MKLFLKHLFVSIKKRPLQPLILLFTFLLAITVCVSSLTLGECLDYEVSNEQTVKYGNADFTIGISAHSPSRFAFTEDVKKIVDQEVLVSGVYELPLFWGKDKNLVLGVATDFAEIGNVFKLQFSEYGIITSATLNESAIVTRKFATEKDLSVGDLFVVNALGYEKSYTVQAISEQPLVATYDVMVNISGVMQLLANDSLLVSALGDSFKPCSVIYVDVLDDDKVDEVIKTLKENSKFSQRNFNKVAGIIKTSTSLESLEVVIDVLIILTCALCSAVIFCCFYVLSAERSCENFVFKIVGAKPWRLNFMQYAEIILYWLLGFALSIPFIFALMDAVINLVGFNFISNAFSLGAIIKGGLILLFVALATATLFIVADRFSIKRIKFNFTPYVGVAFIIFFVCTFVLSVSWRLTCSIIGLISLCLFMFGAIPTLFSKCMVKVDKVLHNKAKQGKKINVSLRYAVKNLSQVSILKNTCRLWALLITIVLTVVLAVVSATSIVDANVKYLTGHYTVSNATEQCANKVASVEGVDNVYSIFMGVLEHENGESVHALSISDIDAVADVLRLSNLPKGNQVAIPVGFSVVFNLKEGDSLVCRYEDKTIEMVVAEIMPTPINIVVFDCENYGIPYNFLTVERSADSSDGVVREKITTAVALELATVVPMKEFFNHRIRPAEIYIRSGKFIAPFIVLFALIGIADNLMESYRSRKEEFELYNLAGASKSCVKKIKFYELLLIGVFGVVVGFIGLVFSMLILDKGLKSLMFNLLLGLLGW